MRKRQIPLAFPRPCAVINKLIKMYKKSRALIFTSLCLIISIFFYNFNIFLSLLNDCLSVQIMAKSTQYS